MRNILIHCKPSLLDQVKEMGLYYTHSNNGEVDVIVPDIDTPDTVDGVYIEIKGVAQRCALRDAWDQIPSQCLDLRV